MLCAALLAFVSSIPQAQDPSKGEVFLPAAPGWQATLVHQGDAGIWYVRLAKVLPQYGCPEIVGCDDKGRVLVLSCYSGKWTAHQVTPDGQWLAPTAPAEVDPRVPGPELYAGGKAGNVFRIVARPRPNFAIDLQADEIAHFPGEEIHTLLAADLRPETPGDELLVFTISGAVHELRPGSAGAGSGFSSRKLLDGGGRVRDALVLPAADGQTRSFVTVSRSGELALCQLGKDGLEKRTLLREPMGLGRLARAPGDALVLYLTRDDGLVLRVAWRQDGSWVRTPIFAGPQGPRGIVAGRFAADPGVETVAVFGYSQQVHLLTGQADGTWAAESIYTDAEQGHWLAPAELDGRNATDELIGSTFGGRIFVLARPPGYGLRIATSTPAGQKAPWRVACKASAAAVRELSPLSYQGGFATKTMVYETLVKRGPGGVIVPGLAAAWRLLEDGRTWEFELREGATFHDGTPVTAEAVAVHMRRWVGLPEHDWLRANARIREVTATGPRALRVVLDRPHALLPDLCAVNPTAIRGPGALDREGEQVRVVGSGPFRWVEAREDGRVLRYERFVPGAAGPGARVDLVRLDKDEHDDPLAALLRGEVDIVLSSWLVRLDPRRVVALRDDPRFKIRTTAGSSMLHVGFTLQGPTAALGLRQRIAAAIDRKALVQEVECGFADPSTGWAAPSLTIWPQGRTPAGSVAVAEAALTAPLRLAVERADAAALRLAQAVVAMLGRHGLPAQIVPGGECDLQLFATHGAPYDPFTTLVSRFGPQPQGPTAESARHRLQHPRLLALVEQALATPAEAARLPLHAAIQQVLDEECLLVPLYARQRIAILPVRAPDPVWDHDLYTLDLSWLTAAEPR